MKSITTPRTKGHALIRAINYPQMNNVLSHIKQRERKIINLMEELTRKEATIDFYNVLYPVENDPATEERGVQFHPTPLKRKLAVCKILADRNMIDELRSELEMIPIDWAPDYLLPHDRTRSPDA